MIKQVVPFISNITSSGYVAIKGSGLGNINGELWLKGLKKWNGASVGDVKLSIPSEQGKGLDANDRLWVDPAHRRGEGPNRQAPDQDEGRKMEQ